MTKAEENRKPPAAPGFCCTGMRAWVKDGTIKKRAVNILTPDRSFYIAMIRGKKNGIILSHCPICGEDIYPGKAENK